MSSASPGRIGIGRVGWTGLLGLRVFLRSAHSFPPVFTPIRAEGGVCDMEGSLSANSIVVMAAEQVSCPLGEESAILNLKNSVYYGLDPVGARVWTLLQEPRSVGELRDTLLSEYEVEAGRCEDDLLALLEKMRSEGLIEVRMVSAA
jgi:Coenzyme PQQ synthesis protein D (PqqD)